ncbi:AraC family transcriptional regulator [Acaryochloris sp. IP29b_bin.137]|uniref:helix-turn-helix transcriptional regulator n=1 Tax=Acaryochloris sp. IP29b_bin.137 TaxID=2969217 RepID=UPI0026056CD3|nr:AraC family transcriptional regulator [Acaryochloris sp. IP29b_bin.137]
MALFLKAAEFSQLCQQGQMESPSNQNGLDRSTLLPRRLGQGTYRQLNLRGGLTIEIREGILQETLRIEQIHEPVFPLTSKFFLAGSARVETPGIQGIQPDYLEQQGFNYLYHLPDLEEIEEWHGGEAIHLVMIYANTDYFHFLRNDQALPNPLRNIFQDQKLQQRFHQSLGPISPAMEQLLQQLVDCPYTGATQALYVESKALELLTLQLETWKQQYRQAPALRKDDIERLHQARDLLIQQSDNPPLLIELAHQVGLNDRKLKQGFRQLFGTTVFGYLQDYRMGQAKQLLEDTSLTIASVALTVGYRNPEAFSTAFRRKFSMSPKAYQLGCRI